MKKLLETQALVKIIWGVFPIPNSFSFHQPLLFFKKDSPPRPPPSDNTGNFLPKVKEV